MTDRGICTVSLQVGTPPLEEPHYGIGFAGAIRRGFVKYATFQGRASRAEYWWWQLFVTLLALGWYLIIYLAGSVGDPDLDQIMWLVGLGGAGYLVVFLPSLALVVRRLHDSGHSGWTYFVTLIPFIGSAILLAFLFAPTSPRATLYGPPSTGSMLPTPTSTPTPSAMPAASSMPALPTVGMTNPTYSDDTMPAYWHVDQSRLTPGSAAPQPTHLGHPSSSQTSPTRRPGRVATVLAVAAVVVALVCIGGTARHLLLQRWDEGSGSTTAEAQSKESDDADVAAPDVSPSIDTGDVDSDSNAASPETDQTEPPSVVGHKPAKATSCPSVYDLPTTPVRSAVNAKTTSCEFAEEVRRAYIESGQQGRTVELTNVYSPRTHKYYVMLCTGSDTVTCTGGVEAEVFLY